MATWQEMSLECLWAAKKLLSEGHLRRSISSSYYAVYSASTSLLTDRGIAFAHGWNNPAHDQLPHLILNYSGLSVEQRRRVSRSLRFLRSAREDSDYRPGMTVDRTLALICFHDAIDVLRLLEMMDE